MAANRERLQLPASACRTTQPSLPLSGEEKRFAFFIVGSCRVRFTVFRSKKSRTRAERDFRIVFGAFPRYFEYSEVFGAPRRGRAIEIGKMPLNEA